MEPLQIGCHHVGKGVSLAVLESLHMTMGSDSFSQLDSFGCHCPFPDGFARSSQGQRHLTCCPLLAGSFITFLDLREQAMLMHSWDILGHRPVAALAP